MPEGVAVNACQACPGYLIERGCRHLQNDARDKEYLVRILHEPCRLRDAFRSVRGGEAWQ